MYQPVVIFLGLRYVRGRASDRFGWLVSLLSIVAISVGVMAMVTVLSVMNGFEKNLEKKILGLIPQVLITSQEGSINPNWLSVLKIQDLKGITRIAPLTTGDIILQSTRSIAVGVMLGVNPDDADPLTPYLVNTKQQQLQPNHYNIIIGDHLANQLKVKRGDAIRLIAPGIAQFTIMGCIPNQRLFTIIGTFHADSEVDSYQFLVNQQDASHLMRYPTSHITGWRLFLQNPLMVDTLSQQTLSQEIKWKDWRDRKGELFQAVHMEKNMMELLLSLIVAVSAFNIITSLGLLIIEKQSEIAILQTQGLTHRQIMSVFMVQGTSAGIIGSLIGTLSGILLASNLNNLMPILGSLIDHASLPVAINPLQVICVSVVVIALSFISTLYPSWRAATMQPSQALRYE